MQVCESIADLRNTVVPTHRNGVSVALVPTMGFLHAGHLSLVSHARQENDLVVVSIFVNPTQFGPGEDYEAYPRDPDRDLAQLRTAGVDVVFVPSPQEMYPNGFTTFVEVAKLSAEMCGKSRPSHFRGVTTVVTKLLNIVQPDRVYFGQKDYQQVTIIRRLVADLNMPVEVVTCSTIREPDGLAMSSRNTYLTTEQRPQATVLWRSLEKADQLLVAGERDACVIRAAMLGVLETVPEAQVDYVEIRDAENLELLQQLDNRRVVIALAVKIGRPRLIDNRIWDLRVIQRALRR